MDYNSISDIQKFLEEHKLSPQKQFGQNFMINPGARRDIVNLLSPKEGELIWEIGPGLGALTFEILKTKAHLKVFEIDRGYIPHLRSQFGEVEGFSLVEGDALKLWPEHINEGPRGIIGNLPYNVATALITDFLDAGVKIPMVFTVQREVAQRMRAKPGDESFGSLSVFCQALMDVTIPLLLKPGSFYPPPSIVSAVVLLKARAKPIEFGSVKTLNTLLRALFSMRRKTILNNVKMCQEPFKTFLSNALEALKIDTTRRAETLRVEEFCTLSEMIFKTGI